ncbi:TetR/AcrR family transcriptional regulator [Bosea caraganae]|uniref:TetR/AcrR family transcriptional regulator n=2 Tax=Bosea caraganae TaxID=2763117 RepID=A0A370L0K3_9HYPH|nr:TetR/AcrR family transcriptional regulator [Bosea caraganae]RDJ21614.1 TetR/AcrR family transcriptional regulator [Bosea caraganae]
MTETASDPHSETASAKARCMPAEKSRPDKHHAITQAASEMFLAEGFERASLDQIAHRAGVSKQTIYSHFADKEALFKAICVELTEKLTIPLRQPREKSADLRSVLIKLGDDALAMMLHPASLDLHRLVMNAAARFPELGRAAYEAGAARMIDDLATLLTQRSQSGEELPRPLSEAEARVLAEQFIGMLRGFHQIRGLLGVAAIPVAERRDYVHSCVELLLRGV